MNKNKFYSIVIVGLIILNIVLIGFMAMPKHGKKGSKDGPNSGAKDGPKQIVVDRLQLSPEQTIAYEELINVHRGIVRSKDHQLRDLKQGLFNELKNDKSLKKDSILNEIASVQMAIERLHFDHFKDIKDLCTSEQKEDFDVMVHDIGRIFRPKGRK